MRKRCECGRIFGHPIKRRRFRCLCGLIHSPAWFSYPAYFPLREPVAPSRRSVRLASRTKLKEFDVRWRFPKADVERMSWGSSPYDMDCKWHIYQRGNFLYLHRSWTERLIFRLRIAPPGINRVDVEMRFLKENTPAHALKLARWLVGDLLIGLKVRFPCREF